MNRKRKHDLSGSVSESFLNSNCLICAGEGDALSKLSLSVPQCKFKMSREQFQVEVKIENEGSEPLPLISQDYITGPACQSKMQEYLVIEDQLKSIFILRKLLDVTGEKLEEYLQRNSGEMHPNSWFSLCIPCGKIVQECFTLQCQINSFEKKYQKNKSILKSKMDESRSKKINEGNVYSIFADIRNVVDLGKGGADDCNPTVSPSIKANSKKRRFKLNKNKRAKGRTLKRGRRRKTSKLASPVPNVVSDEPILPDEVPLSQVPDSMEVSVQQPSFFKLETPPVPDSNLHVIGDLLDSPATPLSINDDDNYSDDEEDGSDSEWRPTKSLSRKNGEEKKTDNSNLSGSLKKKRSGGPGETINEKKTKHENNEKEEKHPNQARHRCKGCYRSFENKAKLEEHFENVHKDGGLQGVKCNYCEKFSRDKIALYKHFYQLHRIPVRNWEVALYCDHCPRVYITHSGFSRHFRIAHEDKRHVSCSFCGKFTESKQILEMHCELEHIDRYSKKESSTPDVEEAQKCELCSEIFTSKMKFDYHLIKAHGIEFGNPKCFHYQCEFVGKTYDALTRHLKKVHQKKEFICEICSKHVIGENNFRNHRMAEHHEELGLTPFKCEECEMTFGNRDNLVNHIKGVHKPTIKYSCEHCGKTFKRKNNLDQHLLLHTAPKEKQYKQGPFFCQFCNAKFNVRPGLYYHLKGQHSDKYLNRCRNCGKGYHLKAILDLHQKTCGSSQTKGKKKRGKIANSSVIEEGK